MENPFSTDRLPPVKLRHHLRHLQPSFVGLGRTTSNAPSTETPSQLPLLLLISKSSQNHLQVSRARCLIRRMRAKGIPFCLATGQWQ